MRILVWNMGHWQCPTERRAAAWKQIESVNPDFALLQECSVPAKYQGRAVSGTIGGRRRWGSAVVAWNHELHPITHASGRASKVEDDLLQTFPGSVAVAGATVGSELVTLVSIYGVIENGYADTTVNKQLSDLAPLFDNPRHEKALLLGGDLNITTQWSGRERRYSQWEQATFDRIRAFGLRDCLDLHRAPGRLDRCWCDQGEDCRHIRTQFHGRSTKPWQNDYVFASDALVNAERISSARVLDEPEWRQYSEHLPLMVGLRERRT